MCGVVAAINLQDPHAPPPDLGPALKVLARRGPDAEGRWSAPGVTLGHRRLLLRDAAGGAQPLVSEDGRIRAVFNGELYGTRALSARLRAEGHRLTGNGDSALLVHLYEERGPEMVHLLRGDFAFIVWDGHRRCLLAARDRFGVKPLRYAVHDGWLWLASELNALLALGLPRRWDEAAFEAMVTHQYLLPQQTWVAGIAALGPGERLLVTPGAPSPIRVERWWEPGFPELGDPGPAVDESTLTARIRRGLAESVALRLESERPVSVALSGGLDGASVLALARRHAEVPAFTIAFEEGPYGEAGLAAETAAALGAPHQLLRLDAAALRDGLASAVAAGQGTCINLHLSARYQLAAALRQVGRPVLLTGEGADELFGGYVHQAVDLARVAGRAPPGGDRVTTGMHVRSGETELPGAALLREQLGGIPAFLEAKLAAGVVHTALLRPAYRGRAELAVERLVAWSRAAGVRPAGEVHLADTGTHLWMGLCLSGSILGTLSDGPDGAWGVEARPPFLDGPLWELLRVLPAPRRMGVGGGKTLLRAAMGGVVPEPVRRRPKHPFVAPPLDQRGFDWLSFWLKRAERLPFYEPAALRSALQQWVSAPASARVVHDTVLMQVVSLTMLGEGLGLG